MTSVQSPTNNGAVSQTLLDAMNPKSTVSTKNADGTDTVQAQTDKFMTLLVTQLQNQDPLNPMDNAEITSQLAQLSTVTGVNQLNTTMTSLMGSYQSSQALQAASMIGHGILAAGSNIALSSSSAVLGVNLTTAADDVTISIQNASGVAVRTMDLGAQAAGTLPLTWDGSTDAGGVAPDGKYTFSVSATRAGVALTDATTLGFGTVASVTSNPTDGVKLFVPALGTSSTVKMADVKQVL